MDVENGSKKESEQDARKDDKVSAWYALEMLMFPVVIRLAPNRIMSTENPTPKTHEVVNSKSY